MSIMSGLAVEACAAEPALIPMPEKMVLREGAFALRRETPILVDKRSKATGTFLAERLRAATGFPFPTRSSGKLMRGAIWLTTKGSASGLGPEGYELIVAPDSVLIRAPAKAGLFYGVESFLQLLPPEVFAAKPVSGVKWGAPCVEIKDHPRFQWRGLMLDVARHFFTKEEVEQILDSMAVYKINTLHLHLTDDEGWRIEIKKYPRLTQEKAWPQATAPKGGTSHRPDGRYGDYYTQDDIREMVHYAAARHITIVPEIEMPAHSRAALAAYPQYNCFGGPFSTNHNGNNVYCVGNDGSFDFLQNILKEVFTLFPGKYIHVGGDEVSTSGWAKCDKCQARKKAEGLKSDAQLESYFIQRMGKFINAHDRSLIGWSEIREGGLAKNATLMDWAGGATEAASAGHDVVMSPYWPVNFCYLNVYQSRNLAAEPRGEGGFLPLRQVYRFEPVPANLPPQFQQHILGAQGNLWGECVQSLSDAEYMIFPRECALAEVTWSPKDARNWDNFLSRVKINERRLDAMGVNYRRNPTQTGE